MGYIWCFPLFVKYVKSNCYKISKILCNHCTNETRNSILSQEQCKEELNLTFCSNLSSMTFLYIGITFSLYLKKKFYKIQICMQPRTFFGIKAPHCRDLRAA